MIPAFAGPRTVCRVLLALSLGLNVLLIGWVAVGSVRPGTPPTMPDPAPGVVAAQIAVALPIADGTLLLEAVARQRQPLQDARRAYLAAFNHLRTTIASEPLDPAALHQAVAELRTTRLAERTLFGDTIVEALLHMTPQGRQSFVATHLGGRQ